MPALTTLERIRLVRELRTLMSQLAGAPVLARIKSMRRMRQVIIELGGAVAAPAAAQPAAAAAPAEPPAAAPVPVAPAEPAAAAPILSGPARFFEHDPNRKPIQRKRDNAAAVELLDKVRAGEIDGQHLDDGQKAILARYSGLGGNLISEGVKGSDYEYYTPTPIAAGAWDLLKQMGFSGGKALDPCGGVGVFGATAPESAAVDAIELSETSGQINGLVNQRPGYSCTVSNFEKVAASTPDEVYDAVVANVPFGGKAARGSNYRDDPKYQDETLEGYFILRSLEKLRPGGLAAFICPPRVVSGKGGKEESVRFRASLMAEFMGAYRLPSHLFLSAGAETITDLLVFRKHSAEALAKIEDLSLTAAGTLRDARVIWGEFVEGGYFAGEGKRFVLGEFKTKDPTKFRDVDRVISEHGAADIARLMTKFGGSRIDWPAIEAAQPEPIIYVEGDTITQAGRTLQMRGGAWEEVQRTESVGTDLIDLGTKLATPLAALHAWLKWAEVERYVSDMHRMSRSEDIAPWLLSLTGNMKRLPTQADRARFFVPAVVALSVADVLHRNGGAGEPVNHLEYYPALSEAMQRHAADAGAMPTVLGGAVRDAARLLRIHYNRKDGFSAIWRGDVVTEQADGRTADQRFEAARYAAGSGMWVSREDAAKAFGADLDPIASPDWCISPDGRSVCKADDFFVGNLADMLTMLRQQAAAATDDITRGKLLAMMDEANRRAPGFDVGKVMFNFASPFVTRQEKVDFLNRTFGEGFHIKYDDGTPVIRFDEGRWTGRDATGVRAKLLNRLAYYVEDGTVTLQGTKFDRMTTQEAMTALRDMAMQADEQFGIHCRASRSIVDRLDRQANEPSLRNFPQTTDETPMPLPGWKLGEPPDGVTPHPYQYAEIRRRGRFFGGINGYDVGLGKSFTALACVQHAHSVGIKRRTAFVVPNSVLSNWQKEARVALEDMNACLFVGLRTDKKGKPKMDSGAYDADLARIAEGRHSKIFMTAEAFRRLRLRDQALKTYIKSLGEDDSAFTVTATGEDGHAEPVSAKRREAVASRGGKLMDAIIKGHSGSAPYLEDLGIDSLVIDEAHCFPAGTLVDGRPIESLAIGDLVRSYNESTGEIESRPVIDTMRREAPPLVRVRLSDGRSIVATHDHPVYVDGAGYINASSLEEWHNLLIDPTFEVRHGKHCGLPRVQKDIQSWAHAAVEDGYWKSDAVLVREVVRNKMEAQAQRKIDVSTSVGGDKGEAEGGPSQERLASHGRGYEEESRIQDFSRITCRHRSKKQGREWKRSDCSAENSFECAWMADGSCCFDGGEAREREAVSLQAGYCEPEHDDMCRSGWQVSHGKGSDRVGLEKGCIPYCVRVESVEVIERGCDGRFGSVCPDGYVYDITVEGNHNFFAEGVLVHNCFKNAVTLRDFKGAKFLSVPEPSAQGNDAQAKAAYIRGLSPRRDGVLLLTATPITNSPSEIYSMLSLAVGHRRVNDMALGVKGPDEFMDLVCDVRSERDETIDGVVRDTRVFRGLRNVDVLRRAIGEVVTIETAETAGRVIQLPDADEQPTPVALPDPPTIEKLKLYKAAYRWSVDDLMGRRGPSNRGSKEAFEFVRQRFGEPQELIGSPFNMIRKMSAVIMDPELDELATFYTVPEGSEALADKVIGQFNGLKLIEERGRPGPNTKADAIEGEKVRNVGGEKETVQKIRVEAERMALRICLDSTDPEVQDRFESLAEKAGLALDVTVPPKLAALLANFRKEEASPRGVDDDGKPSPIVKQIIFCDMLAMHNKIRRVLVKHAGVSAASIAIVTGRKNNKPEEIIEIQNGFNAHGEDNRYRVILANEKAEVGINLQRGTQAIHHLTIGWTPDSLTQRNGRGVRQGNKTAKVTVYHYDADGTFDAHKRKLVAHKAAWIDDVMDIGGHGSVEIAGQISARQQEALMDTVGDAEAMRDFSARLEAEEKAARSAATRERQTVSLKAIEASRQWLQKTEDHGEWAGRRLMELWALKQSEEKLSGKLNSAKSDDGKASAGAALNDLRARMDKIRADIASSFDLSTFKDRYGRVPQDVDDLIRRADSGYSRSKPDLNSFTREFLIYVDGKVARAKMIEGSPMHGDYLAERANADAMIEAARKQFGEYATMEGGIPARVADLVAQGKGCLREGVPMVDGTILINEASGLVRVVVGSGEEALYWSMPSYRGGRPNSVSNRIGALSGETIAYPGTPEYADAAARAAAFEDDIISKHPSASGTKFADLVPEIAQRRRSVAMVPVSGKLLPAPLFPVFLFADSVKGSAFMERLRKDQLGIVQEIGGDGFVDQSVALADWPDGFRLIPALRERAIAAGETIPYGNLFRLVVGGISSNWSAPLLGWMVGDDDLALHMQSVRSVKDGPAAAKAWLISRHPSIEFRDDILDKHFEKMLNPTQNAAYQEALREIAKREAAQRQEALSTGPDDEMIGITGSTFPHKDMIKEMSLSIAGERASMYGKGASFQWNVRRKVWKAIAEKHPDLVSKGILILTEYRK